MSINGATLNAQNITTGGKTSINVTNTASLLGHLQSSSTISLTGADINTNTIIASGHINLVASNSANLANKTKSNTSINLAASVLNVDQLETPGDINLKGSTSAAITGGNFSLKEIAAQCNFDKDFSFMGGYTWGKMQEWLK